MLAPTGSGKTLTAFLWSLDVLFRELRGAGAGAPAGGDPAQATGRTKRRATGRGAGALRLPPQGPEQRRGAEPPDPPGGGASGGPPAGGAPAGAAGGGAHRRYPGGGPPADGAPPAADPDHDPRIAVPDAHVGARGGDVRHHPLRHRGRDPHPGRDEAGGPPGPLPGAPGAPGAAGRGRRGRRGPLGRRERAAGRAGCSGSGSAPPCAPWRRRPASWAGRTRSGFRAPGQPAPGRPVPDGRAR